jgi:hypothetical protein
MKDREPISFETGMIYSITVQRMLLNFFLALSPVCDSLQYISHFSSYDVLHTAWETAVLGKIFFSFYGER